MHEFFSRQLLTTLYQFTIESSCYPHFQYFFQVLIVPRTDPHLFFLDPVSYYSINKYWNYMKSCIITIRQYQESLFTSVNKWYNECAMINTVKSIKIDRVDSWRFISSCNLSPLAPIIVATLCVSFICDEILKVRAIFMVLLL